MSKGWISVHRKIQHHWIWENPLYLKAWIWMILKANHSQRKVLIGSELVEISRGGFVSSLSKIADSTGLTIKQTRTFLILLEKDQMIVKTKGGKWTKIIICNYEFYQTLGQDNDTIKGSEKVGKGQANGKGRTTNNNGNKSNNDDNFNKQRFLPPSLEEIEEYFKTLSFPGNTSPIVEAEKFNDHYISNGWKVSGKTPMENWKAAARNWSKNSEKFKSIDYEKNKSNLPNRYNVGEKNHAKEEL